MNRKTAMANRTITNTTTTAAATTTDNNSDTWIFNHDCFRFVSCWQSSTCVHFSKGFYPCIYTSIHFDGFDRALFPNLLLFAALLCCAVLYCEVENVFSVYNLNWLQIYLLQCHWLSKTRWRERKRVCWEGRRCRGADRDDERVEWGNRVVQEKTTY